jgi:hypothetical protein
MEPTSTLRALGWVCWSLANPSTIQEGHLSPTGWSVGDSREEEVFSIKSENHVNVARVHRFLLRRISDVSLDSTNSKRFFLIFHIHVHLPLLSLRYYYRVAVYGSACHPPAVDGDALATDIVTGCARKKYGDAFEVLGRAPAASGNPLHDLAGASRIRNESFVHLQDRTRSDTQVREERYLINTYIGGYVTWGNAIDINATGGPLVRQCLGLFDREVEV